jgi:hypothetical protein
MIGLHTAPIDGGYRLRLLRPATHAGRLLASGAEVVADAKGAADLICSGGAVLVDDRMLELYEAMQRIAPQSDALLARQWPAPGNPERGLRRG